MVGVDSFELRRIEGLDAVFNELERHCYAKAIVTVNAPVGEPFTFDIQREGDQIKYGYEPAHESLIHTRTLRLIADSHEGVVTIRSFLDETHSKTSLPYKELRMYHVRLNHDHVDFNPLPADAVFEAYTIDDPVDPELEAIYCGPDARIRGEDR